jgi:photosystem II stability/assembly factor-like uncharacterized protein
MKFIFVSLLVVLGLIAQRADCQWIPTNGPYGMPVQILISTEGRLYLNNQVSLDTGRTWSTLNPIIPGLPIFPSAAIADTIFAISRVNNIVRSTDRGQSWTDVTSGIIGSYPVIAFSNSTVYVGTDSGLFKSTILGNSWTRCPIAFFHKDQQYIESIGIFGNSVLVSSLATWLSTDKGVSWVLDTGISNYGVAPSSYGNFNNTIFSAANDYGIKRSSDGGISWQQSNIQPFKVEQYYDTPSIFAETPTAVFVGTTYGLFRSTDVGKTWIASMKGLLDTNVNTIASVGSTMFAGTNFGLFRSNDDGNSWAPFDTNRVRKSVHCLGSTKDELFAGNYSGLFRSTDQGLSWKIDSHFHSPITCIATIDDTVYVGGSYRFQGLLYRSWKPRINWDTLPVRSATSLPSYRLNTIFINDKYMFVGTTMSIFRSDNRGLSWTWEVDEHKDTSLEISSFTSSGSAIFAGTTNGVLRTTDDGVNWNFPATTFHDTVLALITRHDTIFAGTTSQGIFFSVNNGLTWTQYNNNLTNQTVNAFSDSSYLFTGTNNGVFVTSGNGIPWKDFSDGLDDRLVNTFTMNNSNLFAGGAGVWKLGLNGLNDVLTEPINNIALNIISYPNPSDLGMKILLHIPTETIGSVFITDVLGNIMASLLTNERIHVGECALTWNTRSISNGLYYIHYASEFGNQIAKLVVLH